MDGTMFNMIVCADQNYGIGKEGRLPWSLRGDMLYFKNMTTNRTCIFGYNTWKTLPDAAKTRLRERSYVFVTGQAQLLKPEGVAHIRDDGLQILGEGMICGGAFMYEWALQHLDVDTVYLTKIKQEFECDTFFPKEYLNWYTAVQRTPQSDTNRLNNSKVFLESIVYRRTDLL